MSPAIIRALRAYMRKTLETSWARSNTYRAQERNNKSLSVVAALNNEEVIDWINSHA